MHESDESKHPPRPGQARAGSAEHRWLAGQDARHLDQRPPADREKQPRRWGLGCLLPLLIVLLGAGVVVYFVTTREEPEPDEPEPPSATVRSIEVNRQPHRLDVEARGRVEPSRRVTLLPQVGGRIVGVHDELRPGGFVGEGETLVRIEEEDFRLEVEQAESRLTEARAELELERGRQVVAREEWEIFGDRRQSGDEDTSPRLALREPQLEVAHGRVQAAEAALAAARLNRERTSIQAPFDAVVLAEDAAVGQLAGPQTPVAELVDSAVFRIRAAVRMEQLDFIAIPGVNATEGSAVRVRQDLGGTELTWTGKVVRLLSDLSPEGLMALILIEVPDPYRLNDAPDADAGLPLLLNSSVRVVIEGRREEALIEIPRGALREMDRVFVFREDATLAIREPEMVWRLPESVLVRGGLEDGERVIVSPIAVPVEGMRLREEDHD
jgi:multidrug efflux pump subunit AcrA (membrane-fusion protein)